MTLLGRLALLFIVVPLVELALLIQVGRWVGIWPTVGLVFLTGVLGAGLARAEGLRAVWSFRSDVAKGRIPGQAILDGVSILVGGAVLLTPGFVTDVVGFALLLPPSRRLLQRWARRRLRTMIEEGSIRVMTSSGAFGGEWREGDATGAEDEEGAPSKIELDPDKEIKR